MTPLTLKPIIDASLLGTLGPIRAHVDGGLMFTDASGKRVSAWQGGYYGEDRVAAPAAPWDKRWLKTDPDRLKAFAESLTAPLFSFNHENVPLAELGRVVDVIEGVRRYARPGIGIGVWSIVPTSQWPLLTDYAQFIDWQNGKPHMEMPDAWWNHPKIGPARVAAFAAWQRDNEARAAILAPHVDFANPSVYPVQDGPADVLWKMQREPELMIAECRRLMPGKPCYPCYYPFVSATKKVASPALSDAIISTCLEQADGCMIWADGNVPLAENRRVVAGATEHAAAQAVGAVEQMQQANET